MSKEHKGLDTRIDILTPENISFHYQLAGPFHRLPAYLIDLMCVVLIVTCLNLAIGLAFGLLGLGGIGMGIVFTVMFGFLWFYDPLFEIFWNGQTLGKKLFRLRVVSMDGRPLNASQALLRNFLRLADFFPFCYFVGLIAAGSNPRFQRLGDLAAGTMVIVELPRRAAVIHRMDDPIAMELSTLLPMSFQISPSLGKALAAYVHRRVNFSWERRLEIAEHVAEPLRRKMNIPRSIDSDRLLCAVYYRCFLQKGANDRSAVPPVQMPFASVAAPAMLMTQQFPATYPPQSANYPR